MRKNSNLASNPAAKIATPRAMVLRSNNFLVSLKLSLRRSSKSSPIRGQQVSQAMGEPQAPTLLTGAIRGTKHSLMYRST